MDACTSGVRWSIAETVSGQSAIGSSATAAGQLGPGPTSGHRPGASSRGARSTMTQSANEPASASAVPAIRSRSAVAATAASPGRGEGIECRRPRADPLCGQFGCREIHRPSASFAAPPPPRPLAARTGGAAVPGSYPAPCQAQTSHSAHIELVGLDDPPGHLGDLDLAESARSPASAAAPHRRCS